MSAWREARKKCAVLDVSSPKKFWDVNGAQLAALPWEELCRICYDKETPEPVIDSLRYHPDASVRHAVQDRPAVLLGQKLDPFRVPQPVPAQPVEEEGA